VHFSIDSIILWFEVPLCQEKYLFMHLNVCFDNITFKQSLHLGYTSFVSKGLHESTFRETQPYRRINYSAYQKTVKMQLLIDSVVCLADFTKNYSFSYKFLFKVSIWMLFKSHCTHLSYTSRHQKILILSIFHILSLVMWPFIAMQVAVVFICVQCKKNTGTAKYFCDPVPTLTMQLHW